MKHKFILFEGTDASGKTSLAKNMAHCIGGVYYYNPPEIIRSLRSYADGSTPAIRFQYYLLGNYIASEEIKKLLKSTHVVCDWYIYSTVAYHSVLLNTTLEVPRLLLPDNIVFVSANWDEIEKRLRDREIISKYEEIQFLKKVYGQYECLFTSVSNVIKIDSTNKDPKKVVEKLIKHLKIIDLPK
ncbi:MAG: hypothetical protein V1711_01695 [bacterium]